MPSRSQGIHGAGGIDYRPDQAERVLDEVQKYRGIHRRVTVERLAEATGVPGRTVRSILSDHDGRSFLLGGDDDGYYVAIYADDAERFTRRLESQARQMGTRAQRRRAYAETLPIRQGGLF